MSTIWSYRNSTVFGRTSGTERLHSSNSGENFCAAVAVSRTDSIALVVTEVPYILSHPNPVDMPLPKYLRLQQFAMPSRLTVMLVSMLLATPALIFWLWLVTLPARVAFLCPEGCNCDTAGYNIYCSRASLTAVPLIHLTGPRSLELFYNNITLLKKDNFVTLTELESLYIPSCGLRTIELGAFNGLTKLRKLDISHNEISEILPGTFEDMNSLEYLDLKNNRLKYLHPGTFLGLSNLQQLHLENNLVLQISTDSFVPLTELKKLYISQWGLRTIELGAFNGLRKLKELVIFGNKITEILPGTFENMNSLEYLGLSYNRIKHLDSGVFSGLVNLKYLNLQTNQLQYLHPSTFLGLSNLHELHLEYNLGLQISTDRFVSLTELQKLDISRCGMRAIELGAFNGLTELKELDISWNEIREIKPGTFENMNSLEYLDLGYNKLKHLDSGVFSGLVNLKNVSLIRNGLQYLHRDSFLELPNIQQLKLDENLALHIPTDHNFINSPSLSHLDISGCNISSLSVETFANVSALEWLDLSYNNLRTVDINILRALPKLSKMYLDGNWLQCDCQLQEVWRWCKDHKIETAFNYPYRKSRSWRADTRCDTPTEVWGIWWGVLEKGQCLEGNIQYYGDYKNTSYMYTDIDHKDSDIYDVESLKQYQVPIYAFPFIFGTISNVILLIIIICNKDMRTVPNMYIINLAVSDMIYLTVLFSEACANRISDRWVRGEFICTFLPFCRRMSVGLSAYSVAVFSFQRYRVTVDPFQIHVSSHATCRSIVAKICGVWIVAALFSVPSLLSKYTCETFTKILTYYQLVVVFELVVSCVLPICVVAFSYVMTARHLVESSCPISEGTQNPQLRTRRNTAKIVMGLAFVFMISYVPYHVFWTYFIYTEKEFWVYKITQNVGFSNSNYKFQYMYLISTSFLLINSCLNPVALFCTSSPFRQHLKRYLTCFCKTNSPSNDFELTRRN